MLRKKTNDQFTFSPFSITCDLCGLSEYDSICSVCKLSICNTCTNFTKCENCPCIVCGDCLLGGPLKRCFKCGEGKFYCSSCTVGRMTKLCKSHFINLLKICNNNTKEKSNVIDLTIKKRHI